MQIREHQARANALLNRLDPSELATVVPQSTFVTFGAGDVLHEARQPFDHAYFPLRGLVATFVVTRSQNAIETGFVGPSGGLCHPHEDRGDVPLRLVATTVGATLKMPLRVLLPTMQRNEAFRDSVIRFQNRMIYQSHLATACVALHSLRERVCLWLLITSAHSPYGRIVVTQGRMAQHLGVDRARVNRVLQELQKLQIVELPRRGEIWIRDAAQLRGLACECYDSLAVPLPTPLPQTGAPRARSPVVLD